MPVPSFSSWMYNTPFGSDDPATASVHYGPEPWARDQLDARRMMLGSTPESQWPDGYLGTLHTRREDRLLNAVKDRQTARPLQRGVHKGERVDPHDYFWDPEAPEPGDGIKRGMQASFDPIDGVFLQKRATPSGQDTVLLGNRDKFPEPVMSRDMPVAKPVSQLLHLRPNWS